MKQLLFEVAARVTASADQVRMLFDNDWLLRKVLVQQEADRTGTVPAGSPGSPGGSGTTGGRPRVCRHRSGSWNVRNTGPLVVPRRMELRRIFWRRSDRVPRLQHRTFAQVGSSPGEQDVHRLPDRNAGRRRRAGATHRPETRGCTRALTIPPTSQLRSPARRNGSEPLNLVPWRPTQSINQLSNTRANSLTPGSMCSTATGETHNPRPTTRTPS